MKHKLTSKGKTARANILQAAVELSKRDGYAHITRDSIAKHAGVANGSVTKYFNTMCQLRRAVMRAAIAGEVLEIIAQGLVNKDPHALKALPDLQRKALDAVLSGV